MAALAGLDADADAADSESVSGGDLGSRVAVAGTSTAGPSRILHPSVPQLRNAICIISSPASVKVEAFEDVD